MTKSQKYKNVEGGTKGSRAKFVTLGQALLALSSNGSSANIRPAKCYHTDSNLALIHVGCHIILFYPTACSACAVASPATMKQGNPQLSVLEISMGETTNHHILALWDT